MKVAIVLLMSLSLALAASSQSERDKPSERDAVEWDSKPSERAVLPIVNVTQCLYRPVDKVFGCRGVSGEVECPAIFEWPVSGVPAYKVFGLGVVPEFVDAKIELVRYWLYPRSLDNITYVNHTFSVEGAVRDIFLYYGEKFVEYGFRVTDAKCFGRLIGLIRGSSVEHMLPIESDLVVKPVVPMIGEVLVYDKEVSKRWLYGYGFGLGLGGWGYGGLGYGGLGYGGLGYGLGYPFGILGR